MWYVRSGDKNLGPYPEAQLREFIAAGKLPPTAYVLREGTQQWLRVNETPLMQPLAMAEEAPADSPFDYLQGASNPSSSFPANQVREPAKEQLQNPYWTDFAGQPATLAAAGNQNLGYVYRSPQTLKTLLLILAGILVIAHLSMIVSLYLQIDLLTKFKQGFYLNNEVQARADADANDQRHMLVAISYLGLTIVYGIVFLVWTYRVKANTWALGAKGMSITPGWGVGWYFVPFANLVMPYTSMKETWKASASPADWYRQPSSSLIGFWWFFWISSAILGRIGATLSKRAEEIDELLGMSYFDFYTEFYEFLPLIFVTLLVLQISKMQTNHALEGEMSARDTFAS